MCYVISVIKSISNSMKKTKKEPLKVNQSTFVKLSSEVKIAFQVFFYVKTEPVYWVELGAV